MKKIKVVMCEPEQYARVVEIEATLESYQKIVGGYIEAIYPFDENVCLVCNEEGKIDNMRLNRAIRKDGKLLDFIAGTFFVCDCSEEDFGSLTDEQAKRYMEKFKYPEMLVRQYGQLVAVPFKP